MERILHRPDVLYLIFVRQCYNLKFWLRPLHRNKLLKAITVCQYNLYETSWYIKPYNKLILHRENGPAILENNGSEKWFLNGQLHRDYGPAVIYADGSKFYWFKNCQLISGSEIVN